MRRSAGFTIVEILVALGIMGVVTLAAMSLLNFSNIGMKDIKTQSDWADLKNEVEMFISSPDNCKSMLAAWPMIPNGAGDIAIDKIATSTGAVIAATGLAKSTFTVDSMTLTDFSATSSPN